MAQTNDLLRTLLIVVAIAVLIPFLMMLFAWPMMGMWGGGHMWDGGAWNGTGPTWTMVLFWLLPLVVLLAGGYFLYRALGSTSGDEPDEALEELRLAYARGDLSDEEFEERRDRLRRE